MRGSSLAALVGLLTVAAAQSLSDLPACAVSCLSQVPSSCAGDIVCICQLSPDTQEAYFSDYTVCVTDHCTSDSLESILSTALTICQNLSTSGEDGVTSEAASVEAAASQSDVASSAASHASSAASSAASSVVSSAASSGSSVLTVSEASESLGRDSLSSAGSSAASSAVSAPQSTISNGSGASLKIGSALGAIALVGVMVL